MSLNRAFGPLLVSLSVSPAPGWAGQCQEGPAALHAAMTLHLADNIALLRQRGVADVTLVASPEDIVGMMAETFALTPTKEHLLVYTQTETGLCALVFDGVSVTATAERPGQGPEALTEARLALSAALDVEARQLQRAGQMRGVAPLDTAAGGPADRDAAASRLADLLMLTDLAPALAGADEILLLPPNDIGTVPFAVLPIAGAGGGGMLIDLAPVTVAPSATALVRSPDVLMPALAEQLTTGPAGFTPVWSGAVVVGDPAATDDPDWDFPPLPGARAEAQAIADRFAVSPILGEKATLDAVLSALTQPVDLVYFAAHGVSSADAPLYESFLALAGGRLTAAEVQTLRLPNRPLVVLSACQTGLGRSHAGGTIGLSRAFVLAGASAVVSTLWNVNDRATEDLMRDFADNLHGMRPADALHAAMLAARDRHPDDPALWAGVILFGGLSVLGG